MDYSSLRTDVAAIADRALPLCRATLPGFEDAYLLDRLPMVRDPLLIIATAAEDVGFKLGYLREPGVFYSWLGGVREDARGAGVASELMLMQHRDVEARGLACVETRCRAANNKMLILNLRHGFNVVGFEMDATRGPIVLQRKVLG